MVEYFTDDELRPWFERPPFDPTNPGELGKGVKIEDESEEVKKKIKEGWDKHAFNHYVCEKISLHRSLGDTRDKEWVSRAIT